MRPRYVGLIIIVLGVLIGAVACVTDPGETVAEYAFDAGEQFKFDGFDMTINNTHYENVQSISSQEGELVVVVDETPHIRGLLLILGVIVGAGLILGGLAITINMWDDQ